MSIKKLTATDGSDGYVLHGDIEPLKEKINELIDEIDKLKIQLSMAHKDKRK